MSALLVAFVYLCLVALVFAGAKVYLTIRKDKRGRWLKW